MDIIIENNEVIRVVTERNDLTANINYTPAVKNFILAIYQAGRDKEMINFSNSVELTINTEVEQN
ncbi:MAG: hypothetical protein E6R13_07225 [Spirochaetes bacterium]|nr:MAG: hypothetical protein E6R13_07225 [Spirochaetota bacterium]